MKKIINWLFPRKKAEKCLFISYGGFCTHASEYDFDNRPINFPENHPLFGRDLYFSPCTTVCKDKNRENDCKYFKAITQKISQKEQEQDNE